MLVLALVGREVGDNWDDWRDHLHYLDYAVLAAIVIGDRLPARPPAPRDAEWEPTPPA